MFSPFFHNSSNQLNYYNNSSNVADGRFCQSESTYELHCSVHAVFID